MILNIIALLICLLLADWLSGIAHWFEDNYLDEQSSEPWLSLIALPNIAHHTRPTDMARGTYWQTNRVGIIITLAAAILLLIFRVVSPYPFVVLAILSHSNQVHKWAHSKTSNGFVNVLRVVGLLQSPTHHAVHHKDFSARYCVVTDLLNPILDGFHVWRRLEMVLDLCFGLTPKRTL